MLVKSKFRIGYCWASPKFVIKPIAPAINRFGGGRKPPPNPRFSFSDAISRVLRPFLEVGG
jgi:hypothetical protein